MARNFLTSSRHGTVFYFRRRIPADLRIIIGKSFLFQSLQTAQRGEAVVLARALAAKTDRIYRSLRAMKKRADEGFQVDYTLILDLGDQGEVRKIHVEALPEESESVAELIAAAMQNRPPHVAVQNAPIEVPSITATALLEDFYREGIGSERWKNPETTRVHDYGPIWAKFAIHANRHGLTLSATKAYRAEVLGQTVARQTKIRNLSRVHSVILHGVTQHDLDEKILRPLKPSTLSGSKKKSNVYLPFTTEELSLLFLSSRYAANAFKKPSHYWLPMLGLYTGARLEELAGLHLSAFSEVDKISAVSLMDDETTDGGKNDFAVRVVPLHRELIAAGLLEYVEVLRSEGHKRLFPDIGEASRDGYGKRATVDFTDYRRSVGVGKDKGERSRQVFHSFRSTLSGKLFLISRDSDLNRRLTGHAAIDVHGSTYLASAPIPMVRASEVMNQISFGLAHPHFSDSDAYVKARNRKKYEVSGMKSSA